MKDFLHLRMLALVAAGLLAACPRAGAQGFGLSVTPSASSMLVSNSLTYTINVTNLTQLPAPLPDVLVTNMLPSSVLPLIATNNFGSVTNYGSVVVFDVTNFFNGTAVQLSLVVQPTAAGSITNTVTVFSVGVIGATNSVVVQVTNAPIITTDLGVAVTGPRPPVITNDWVTYGVIASNAGPNAATGVTLTNTLPPGVILRGTAPANYTVVGSNLIFNLGTLAVGGYTNFQFSIQPTNAGPLILSASIGSAMLDTNPANNLAVTNIAVTNYLSELLVAVTNSIQTINRQNGLEEQFILLTNTGGIDVPAARVVVTGLTKQLFNAVGTNNGSPFVDFSAGLAAGTNVTLLLQYAPRGSFPFTNGQLHAFALPAVPDWTPPAATPAGTNFNITRIALTNGNLLIEWPATPNRTYTVVYSDNASFSNAMMAPPSITAPANEVQWTDYGPPTTVSTPANAGSRFYRVLLNP
jgi:uncharacterized repeat protein (TIGR01451 family)